MGCSGGLVSHFTGCLLQEPHVCDGLVLCFLGVPTRVAWPYREKECSFLLPEPISPGTSIGIPVVTDLDASTVRVEGICFVLQAKRQWEISDAKSHPACRAALRRFAYLQGAGAVLKL